MTIKFFSDRIQIGDFNLFEGNGGIQFDGVARAEQYRSNYFQGSVSGYTSGGYSTSIPGSSNVIDKFPFTSDTNATDVGDLTVARYGLSGQSSPTHGFNSGGVWVNTIDRFPFTTDTNASDFGDLTVVRMAQAGASSSVNGYAAGSQTPGGIANNTVDKFSFSTSSNATDVGDLTQARGAAGQSSSTSGYASGGRSNYPGMTPSFDTSTVIDKFPFATDTNATSVGSLTETRANPVGISSNSYGYSAGGYNPGPVNTIDKFPFAADSNATDVGDLSALSYGGGGSSSHSMGYSTGGFPGPTGSTTIYKFPFATDTNASSIGNLTQSRYGNAGQQH